VKNTLGKTETIKERAIWVYLPTIEQRKKWEQLAKEDNMSLSKWILIKTEESLQEKQGIIISKKDLESENINLKQELTGLQQKYHNITIIREKLEEEIKKYRTEPFSIKNFEGKRRYDKELIELLRNAKTIEGKPRYITNDEILTRLGIRIIEENKIGTITKQLSLLESYNLVESKSGKGWRWIE
jgi:hypothetical protein